MSVKVTFTAALNVLKSHFKAVPIGVTFAIYNTHR